MNKEAQAVCNDMSQLAEDARTLMTATAGMAGVQLVAARNRLAAALDSGKEMYGAVRDSALESARAANVAIREHPFSAIATSMGIGAIVGYLIARRCRCS